MSHPRRSSPRLASTEPRITRCRHRNFVLEVVPGQGGVVDLNVDLHLVLKAVALKEGEAGLRVVVVLVLVGSWASVRAGRPAADLVLVLNHLIEETTELIEFFRKLGVEQCLVPFTPTPEDIVGAAETMGDIEPVLHLCCSRRRPPDRGWSQPRPCSGVSKSRAVPGSFHRIALMSGQVIGELEQVRGLLSKRCALGRNIVIMGVVRHPELLEELERHPIFDRAASIGARFGSNQGRSNVPSPKASLPGQLNECQ